MIEDSNKFYLGDRWFYKIKENDEIITYSSKPNNILAGITLEYNKKNNNLMILYFKDKKMLSKITISNINDTEIDFHYIEKEPQLITIKDNEYVNLILEATTKIKYGRRTEKDKVIIKRKRILNKLCYREPDFPLDTELELDSINIESPYLDYFKKIIDFITMYKMRLQFNIEKTISKKESNDQKLYKTLTIPNELFFYDRNYTFVKHELNRIIYKNDEDGEYTIEINHDFNYNFLTDVILRIKEITSYKNNDLVLHVTSNQQNCTIIKFKNNKKINMKLSSMTLENVLFEGNYTFDKEGKMLSNNIIILNGENNSQKSLHLTSVPIFTNLYVDDSGNEYRINNSEFATLSMIAKFSSTILSNFEKQLTK